MKLPALAAALACCVVLGPAASDARVNRFDTGRAWSLVQMQLSYGQRPAGSPQLRRLANRLRARLPRGRFEALPGEPGLRNIVGAIPGSRPGIVIGAHYDTLADPKGFVGANNGAAGTAVVVEVARALARAKLKPGREIRFVLFDGEEPARGLPEEQVDFYNSGLRGSRAYVGAHRGRTAAMVLLDYVGNKGLSLPREGNSSRQLWSLLRSSARSVGAISYFPDATGPGYLDDHSPFIKAGVPAIDLIDPNYRGHDASDRIDRLSKRSIDAVGETVTALALRLR
ncbi:MAG TPA: M28 family metallopeptidase [Thermoleophilaceae bacterium]|nr:M28 family metallopeptidase [Thermoleophilaceae bacterium]